MQFIKNSCINSAYFLNKSGICLSALGVVTAIAITLIGTSNSNNFFIIAMQLDPTTHEMLLTLSALTTILGLLCLAASRKKKLASPPPAKEQTVGPMESIGDIGRLPVPITTLIFSYLDPDALDKCGRFQEWRILATDPKLWDAFDITRLNELFPSLFPIKINIFGIDRWASYAQSHKLDCQGASPFNKRTIILRLMTLASSLRIENDAGLSIMTIPKGITWNALRRINAPETTVEISRKIPSKYGDLPLSRTITIVITNNILKGSQSNHVSRTQEELVSTPPDVINPTGGRLPTPLEVVALITLIHKKTPTDTRCLYRVPTRPLPIYTHCSGKYDLRHLAIAKSNKHTLIAGRIENEYWIDYHPGPMPENFIGRAAAWTV